MLKGILERALLVCAGIVFALITAEGLVYVGYWAILGHRFPGADYRSAMLERTGAASAQPQMHRPGEDDRGAVPMVIHPYLGFVPAPGQITGGTTIGDPLQIPPQSDRELNVGVFGGSFAAGLCAYAKTELRRVLAPPGKDVRVLCMTAGGYKQPQQLLALAYLLAQGAHFDLVLNVDGFNEVSLPAVENEPQGVAPIYPRAWFWRVGDLEDPDALKLLGELSVTDRDRRSWAKTFVHWGLDRSALLTQVWASRDRLFDVERNQILTELRDHKIEQRKSYAATGPTMTFADDESRYAYLARLWRDSSLQMKLLCDGNGIAYDHFLQPNQYVEGSKPMGPEELRETIRPGPYSRGVVGGYPHLRREGEELVRAGLKFHDLTMVFKDVQERLYKDGCCHLTGPGYIRIARVIGESVRAERKLVP